MDAAVQARVCACVCSCVCRERELIRAEEDAEQERHRQAFDAMVAAARANPPPPHDPMRFRAVPPGERVWKDTHAHTHTHTANERKLPPADQYPSPHSAAACMYAHVCMCVGLCVSVHPCVCVSSGESESDDEGLPPGYQTRKQRIKSQQAAESTPSPALHNTAVQVALETSETSEGEGVPDTHTGGSEQGLSSSACALGDHSHSQPTVETPSSGPHTQHTCEGGHTQDTHRSVDQDRLSSQGGAAPHLPLPPTHQPHSSQTTPGAAATAAAQPDSSTSSEAVAVSTEAAEPAHPPVSNMHRGAGGAGPAAFHQELLQRAAARAAANADAPQPDGPAGAGGAGGAGGAHLMAYNAPVAVGGGGGAGGAAQAGQPANGARPTSAATRRGMLPNNEYQRLWSLALAIGAQQEADAAAARAADDDTHTSADQPPVYGVHTHASLLDRAGTLHEGSIGEGLQGGIGDAHEDDSTEPLTSLPPDTDTQAFAAAAAAASSGTAAAASPHLPLLHHQDSALSMAGARGHRDNSVGGASGDADTTRPCPSQPPPAQATRYAPSRSVVWGVVWALVWVVWGVVRV